jgi:hypothetical protein
VRPKGRVFGQCRSVKNTAERKATMQQTIFASEAYASIETIPSPKAWSLGEDGTVLLMEATSLRKDGIGRIQVLSHGRHATIPLMMDSEWCRCSGQVPSELTAGMIVDPQAYADLIEARLRGAGVDGRLSPASRRMLGQFDPMKPDEVLGTSEHDRYHVDYAAREIMRLEMSSLRKRIRVRALGFGRGGATGCAKLINSYLWADLYDREIACTAIAAFGRKATTADYNRIAEAWTRPLACGRDAGLRSMLRTHRPAIVLLPVLMKDWTDPMLRDDDVADAVPVSTEDDASVSGGRMSEIVADAPAAMKRVGLKPAVWRMMLRMSDPQIAAISTIVEGAFGQREAHFVGVDFFADADAFEAGRVAEAATPLDPRTPAEKARQAAVDVLNRMAELEAETAPRTFLRAIAIMPDQRRELLPLYLGGILDGGRAARRRKLVKDQAFTIGLIADAFDAFHAAGDAVAHTRNLGWTALSGLSARWHANADFGSAEALTLEWPALLPKHDTPTASAVELATGTALAQEGKTMGHCVAGYAHACATGQTRIFSLKASKGEHRSTAEYRLGNDGTWRLVQHRNRGNRRPTGGLGTWIRSLTTALNKAQRSGNAARIKADAMKETGTGSAAEPMVVPAGVEEHRLAA